MQLCGMSRCECKRATSFKNWPFDGNLHVLQPSIPSYDILNRLRCVLGVNNRLPNKCVILKQKTVTLLNEKKKLYICKVPAVDLS